MKLGNGFYAVQITRKDGTKFLAQGDIGSPVALYTRHAAALNFARNLRDHISGKTKVVRAYNTVEWEAQ